jgi:MarR family transcriptional regulator, 2-MHQ and catechol-resistance regulon repressor
MPTHFKGPKEQVLALDTYIKLMRCSDSVTARLNKNLDDADLTYSQFGVMEALHHLGPMCLSEIARKILKTGGNLTLVVSNLEKRKLVQRKQESEDRRFVTIHLTAKGSSLIEKVFRKHAGAIEQAMSALEPVEQKRLGLLCRKLGLAQGG